MPLPTLSDVHISQPLTNMSVAYVQQNSKYKAGMSSPIVNVNKQANSYFTFSKADFMRDGVQLRSPGSGFARLGYSLSSASYSCVQYAAEFVLADEIRENFDAPLKADQAAVDFLMQQFMIRRERAFVTNLMGASIWGNDVAGHAANNDSDEHIFWDNASADIIGNIWKWCDEVEENTGFRPNRFNTGPIVARTMLNDPDIIARHQYTSGDPISLKAVAALCGLGSAESPGEIVVMSATYNSANEGAAASMGYMVGDVGLLHYVAPSPQLNAPSSTYTFSWSPFDGVRDGAAGIETYREERLKSDIYRGMMYFDIKAVATDCGVWFSNILT